MISAQGQQALRVALLNSHPSLDVSTTAALKQKVAAATKQISALVTKARVSKTVVKQYPKECVFPFTYYGVTYTTCTNIGEKGQGTYKYGWCATAVDKTGAFVVGSGDYVECEVYEDASEKPSMSDIMNPPPTTAAPVPPKTEPSQEEAQDKCVLGKPDCGLLTDNMALMR